mgnify:CR=1 FL=1
MFERLKTHLLMHLIIIVLGFTGILGKLIHLDALPLVWHRVAIGFVSLFVGLFLLKMPMKIKSVRHVFAALGIGSLVAIHWVTFYQSIQLSTASLGILCLATATLHVTWLEPIVMKTRFSWVEFLLGLLVIYGIYIVSGDFTSNDYLALTYGLISALCAAAFNVLNGKLVRSVKSTAITLYELGFGTLVLGVFLMIIGEFNSQLFVMSWSDFLWLLFLGVICTSLAFLLVIDLTKKLGSFTVTLNINLEPVYTMVLAVFILNEHTLLSSRFYFGSAIIVVVVLANGLFKYRRSTSKKRGF